MVRRIMLGSIESAGWVVTVFPVTTIDLDPAPIAPPGALGERVTLPCNLVLLRGHGRVVLIDAGFGPLTFVLPGVTEDIDARLAEAGTSRTEIDTIILSHGDFDHIGGLVIGTWPDSLVPAFPNARVAVNVAAADFVRDLPEDAADHMATRILDVIRRAGLLDEVADGDEVAPGIRLVAAPGHAPGHCVVELGDYVHAVDVLHHVQHVPNPEWDQGFDRDPAQGLATRNAWIERLAADGRIVSFAHIEGFGRIERDGDAFRFAPLA